MIRATLIVAATSAIVIWRIAAAQQPAEVPNDALTPGIVASTDENEVCGIVGGLSYSERHRHTTAEMKAEVRKEYGQQHCGEIDHRLELSLGGADDVRNLWCQPGTGTWSFADKDRLELYAWKAVCQHHSVTLRQAQSWFLAPADWRTAYCGAFPSDRRCH